MRNEVNHERATTSQTAEQPRKHGVSSFEGALWVLISTYRPLLQAVATLPVQSWLFDGVLKGLTYLQATQTLDTGWVVVISTVLTLLY